MKALLLLVLASSAFAAPTAIAWTSPTAMCWNVATAEYPTAYPLIARPWDTSGNHANQLVGTGSINAVSYFWTFVSAVDRAGNPISAPVITSPTSATTTVFRFGGGLPVLPGYYVMHLHVVDAMAATSDVDVQIGAIGIDPNGKVIPSSANEAKIFGSQIALGYNPWCYFDERHVAGINLQIANNQYWTNQASWWSVNADGTISYPYAGINNGFGSGANCYGGGTGGTGASLTAGIIATDTTIPIQHAECLDGLTSLPTWVWLGQIGEYVRVIATSTGSCASPTGGTTGSLNLCVGYDGRGISSYPYGNFALGPAAIWPINTGVGEMRIKGTGTHFQSDAARPLAPAGVPGPPGPIAYNTGTVDLDTGTPTKVTGHSTVWTTDMIGNMFRATGTTHGGGTPFVFWRRITAVPSGTELTLDHALPTGFDNAMGLSYSITGPQYWDLHFADTVYQAGEEVHRMQNGVGCESETACFATPASGAADFDSTIMTGMHFSYKPAIDNTNGFGVNFYGTGLGGEAFYFRSGWQPAQDFAVHIDDYWIRDPQYSDGWTFGGQHYNYSGSYLGGVAQVLINPSAITHVSNLRPSAGAAATFFAANANSCNGIYSTVGGPPGQAFDLRDQSVTAMWEVMAAIAETDVTFRNTWLTALGSAGGGAGMLGRDSTGTGKPLPCKRADKSFGIGLVGGPTVHLTNGSATFTSASVTNQICYGAANVTITVTNGSPNATFSMDPGTITNQYNIAIFDTTSSPKRVLFYEFSHTGTTVHLAADFAGMSGTFAAVIQQNTISAQAGGVTAIGFDTSDASNVLLQEGWACTVVDPTTGTLNKPWDDDVTGASTLNGGINSAVTTFTLTSSTLYSPGQLVGIDSEAISCTTLTGNVYSGCTRGFGGSTPASHSNGATVTLHPTGDYIMYPSPAFGVGNGGYFVQPFMFGMKSWQINEAATYVPDATINAGNLALLGEMTPWYHDNGVAPATLGTLYAAVQNSCTPYTQPSTSPIFISIHGTSSGPGCDYSGLEGDPADPFGRIEFLDRVNTAEAFNAIVAYYKTQCLLGVSQCNAARTFGDNYYGAIWGKPDWTAAGYYSDTHYVFQENNDPSLSFHKWFGFFFGMGMGHQWPAVRCENAEPGTPGCAIIPIFTGVFSGGNVVTVGNVLKP